MNRKLESCQYRILKQNNKKYQKIYIIKKNYYNYEVI